MKATKTWILIADGARARVLENTGPGKGLTEVDGLEFAQEPLKNQDLVSDKPGRAFSSIGHGRSSMEPPTDPADKREADFVTNLAGVLDDKAQKGAYHRLIIAAAPQALGNLRKALTPRVQELVHAELAKDLTKIPNDGVIKHFEDVLAV